MFRFPLLIPLKESASEAGKMQVQLKLRQVLDHGKILKSKDALPISLFSWADAKAFSKWSERSPTSNLNILAENKDKV